MKTQTLLRVFFLALLTTTILPTQMQGEVKRVIELNEFSFQFVIKGGSSRDAFDILEAEGVEFATDSTARCRVNVVIAKFASSDSAPVEADIEDDGSIEIVCTTSIDIEDLILIVLQDEVEVTRSDDGIVVIPRKFFEAIREAKKKDCDKRPGISSGSSLGFRSPRDYLNPRRYLRRP